MLQLIVLIVTALANVVVGLLVLLKNTKSDTNRMFFCLTAVFAGWSVINYISLHPFGLDQLTWIRLVLFCAAILNLAVYLTFDIFPANRFNPKGNKRRRRAVYFTVLAMMLTLTPLVFRDLNVSHTGAVSPVPGPGIPVFMLQTLLLLGGGIYLLISKYLRSSGIERRQLKFVLAGIITSFGLIFFTNFLAVVVFGRSDLIPLGPSYTLFFSGFMAYAIVKHRLLDIRPLVARSVAYLFSLAVLVGPYILTVLLISAILFPQNHLSVAQLVWFSATAVVFGLTFRPVQEIFDKYTKQFFFRDAYSSQEVLDHLGSVLATEIDLRIISQESARVITDSLKPLHFRFVVFKDGETHIDIKTGQPPRKDINRKDFLEVKEVLVQRPDLERGSLLSLLNRFDAEILLKLRTNEETVGIILLGPKQSGTVYSQQDIDLLTILEKELAIAVQNARYFEQIQEFNAKLQEEIREATAELRASNTKLKELDEAKDEFISMASHQLRTPLTSVKGYISMVMDGDSGKIKPEQKKLLEEAFASSQRMVYLIADLLNVSRLKTGKFVIEPSEVNLAKIVQQEVDQLKPTARSRKLKLKYDKPESFPAVWLDETKIRQVIMNFIDNAIYYTPAGGEINVSLTAKKSTLEFKVKDNGIGVPEEEQAKLFAKFYRAGNAKQARPDGTGLGLYMAQRVVSAQGGSIIFQSKVGQGSTFGFSFPLSSVKTKRALEGRTKEALVRPGKGG